MKLGKHAPKFNVNSLNFRSYLGSKLPPPPDKVYREYKIPPDAWGMFGNDTIGDCTLAAIAHLIMLWTSHAGKLVIPDQKDVIAAYSAITGYNPVTGANDDGAAITDVLNYCQTTGVAGHKILGWAQLDHKNITRRAQGVWLFGALNVGVQLPANAQDQFTQRKNWELEPYDGGNEGGHCIIETGYGREGENYCSWGRGDQKASRAWTNQYVDEAYVAFTPDWIDEASGLAPNGFNVDALRADLKALAA